jgi:hypothetical protein
MYSVFVSTLQTDYGKELVRSSVDAHSIFKDLVKHYEQSAKANIDSQELLKPVTSIRLGSNSPWKGISQDFILHLQEKLRLSKQVTRLHQPHVSSIRTYPY